MISRRGNLQPAHRGYRYQDIATAYILIRALVEAYDEVVVNRKQVADDRIDDLEVRVGEKRTRRQFKSSDNPLRALSSNDFSAAASSLRFDRLLLTHVRGGNASVEYRLCATWQPPVTDDTLLSLLVPAEGEPTFTGSTPRFFRLRADRIWPESTSPIWLPLESYAVAGAEVDRDDVVSFCEKFLIELELPIASTSLSSPGPFEHCLLDLLTEQVGIGRYPNHGRVPSDVAALAVSLANLARTQEAALTPADVARELAIRTDFGCVAQAFPVDESLFQDRPAFRRSLFESALAGGVHLVIAPPGAGKSWELTRLADELKLNDAIVARHYCYLEPGDELVERRITTDVFFGNLLAGLNDAVPKLWDRRTARFSAGLVELEATLQAVATSERRVVLIVDGLDHIARVRSASHGLSDDETDIVERLATLTIPRGVSIVIGSQPGEHLEPLRTRWQAECIEHQVPAWTHHDVIALARRHNVEHALGRVGITDPQEIDGLLALLAERADGNPLYTHYLAHGLFAGLQTGSIDNPHDWLYANPAIAGDIAVYYTHLYWNASQQAKVVADLLGVIEFSISETELREIIPPLSSWLPQALVALSPVLTKSAAQGGLRIFHESFRRFMLDELSRQGRQLTDVVEPVIAWLVARGFYQDAKSYRFLLPALRRADRTKEVLEYITTDFVADSVAHVHPIEAIQKNLALAADIAGHDQNWPMLVRCAELRRALSTTFDGTQEPWDEIHATYVELYGPNALAERLLFDGRPTQSRDEGLLACSFIDDAGGTAPWREYLELPIAAKESIHGDSFERGRLSRDDLVNLAAVHGRLRLGNCWPVIRRIYRYLRQCGDDFEPNVIQRIAIRLSQIVSPVLVEQIAERANPARRGGARITPRAATALRLGVAEVYRKEGNLNSAAATARLALNGADTPELAVACWMLGAPAVDAAVHADSPESIPIAVGPDTDLHESSNVRRWVASIRLLAESSTGQGVLESERQRVQGVGWYRCWLRFVIGVAAAEGAKRLGHDYDIKRVFNELTRDVAPFRGTPRPCDLYAIRFVIQETIALGLALLRTVEEWEYALRELSTASAETGSRIDREDGGPIPIGYFIDLLVPFAADPIAGSTVRAMIERKVDECHAMGTYYSMHAEYTMRLARVQALAGNSALACANWRRASAFLTAYGWRKDITLFDLIESTPALAAVSQEVALTALHDIQPSLSAVLRHTDGRETKRMPNAWFRNLLKIAPVVAIEILARTLLEDEGIENWPTVDAIEDVARVSTAMADPLLVDALWETLLFDVEYENQSGGIAEERIAPLKRLFGTHQGLAYHRLRRLAAEAKDDGRRHTEAAIDYIESFADEVGVNILQIASGQVKRLPSSEVLGVGRLGHQKVAVAGMRVPAFPPDPQFVQLLSGLRAAGQDRVWGDPDAWSDVVLSLSYRLGDLADSGKEADARRLLHFFARDLGLSMSSKVHPLSDLAVCLENAGYISLAVIAYALAYTATRGGGGWLSFGDHAHSSTLKRAMELDREAALQTVADEVAYRLRHVEYGAGISRHLIERIAEWGEPKVAEVAWREAFAVISKRLPLSSGRHYFAPLDLAQLPTWSINEALVALLLTRIAEPRLTRKIAALAGVVRAIQYQPNAVSTALRWWLSRDAQTSSVLLVLHALLSAEEQPFSITRVLQDVLTDYGKCSCWGLGSLARLLLKRANLQVPTVYQVQSMENAQPALSQPEIERLLSSERGDTIRKFSDIWPELPELVAKRLHTMIDGVEAQKERIYERYRLALGRDGKSYPPTPVLHWETELLISAEHEYLSELPERLWKEGAWGPDIEHESLMAVLPDTALHLALAASRTVRPKSVEPSTLSSGAGPVAILLDDDPSFTGWSRLGVVERQYVDDPDSRFSRPVEVVQLFAGVVALPPLTHIPASIFPFEDGETGEWWLSDSIQVPYFPQTMTGRIVRARRVRDWLGDAIVLIPPSAIHRYMQFKMPKYGEPLMWLDHRGLPAIVLRTWRIRNRNEYDGEPVSFQGSDLIARPDVAEQIKRVSVGPLQEVRHVSRDPIQRQVK